MHFIYLLCCREYYCDLWGQYDNREKAMFKSALFNEEVMKRMRILASHSSSLILNVNSNIAEQFNAGICQKIGGKSVFYPKRKYCPI